MREWIARLTHPSRFRPRLMLAAAVGVTALFFAVIAVNVQLAHQLAVFHTNLANHFTRHLLVIARVTAVLVLLLTAVWIVIVLMMRRFYEAQARTETALRESELRYRTLFEYAGDYVLVLERDEQGMPIIVDANRSALEVLGYARDEIVGRPISLIDPDISPEVVAKRRRSLDSDARVTFQVRRRRKDGSEFLAESTGTTLKVGERELVLAVERDITQRMRTQEALRESETKYHALIDALPHGVVIMQDGIFRFSNPAANAMFGCSSPDGLAGLPWETIVAERDRERVRGIMEARARGEAGVPTQYPVVMRRGEHEEFPAELYVRPLQYGGSFAVQEVILDVTERQRTEEALRESEERFRNLADQAPVLIWMAGGNRHTFYFNRTWQTFTGRSIAQEYGQGWQQEVHPEDLPHLLAAYDSAFAARSPLMIEYRLHHADGTYHWVLDTGIPRFASEQRFIGYIGSCVDISARRETEQALRESEQRYRLLLESVSDVIWTIDLDLRFTYISPARKGLAGYAPEELLGRSVSEIVAPSSIPLFEQFGQELARSLSSGSEPPARRMIESEARHKNGSTVWIEVTIAPHLDADGRLLGFTGATSDITERKRAAIELQTSQERLKEAQAIGKIGNWELDLVSGHSHWSDQMYCLYERDPGTEPPALDGEFAAFCPEDMHALRDAIERVTQCGESCALDIRVTLPSGKSGWHHGVIQPVCDEHGKVVRLVGTVQDISERKRTEEVLLVSKAHLLNAIRIAKLGYWEYDFVKDVFTFNDEFYALFRTTVEQVGGYTMPAARYAELFVHPEDIAVVAEEVRKAAESTNPNYSRQLEHRIVYGDGKTGHVAVRFQIVKDSEGRTIRSYGMNQDITEGKRAADALIEGEEQLRQSQKMEAIGRMAGGIAHDFNNLLTSILGHNEITLRGLPTGHPLRDGIEEVAKAAERAAALTRQLLTFSRKQVLQPRVLDLNAIVTDMEKMLRRLIGEDIELLTRLQPDLGTTKADPSQIGQVLMNLVMNARDAMPAGGRLIIETANVAPDEIQDWRRKKAAPEPYVLLAVSDNGTGMDAETRSHIYEPFFTTKECSKGTGLGLSTVYGIVKQSGGHIWVYSEVGRGSVFRIYLPRVAEAAEELKPPESNVPPNGHETILLVEDEDCVRNLMRQVLEGKGYRVRAARLPSEALQLAEIHHGAIDLLIADVIVPEISGGELAEKVIALHPETKVLFISGYPHHSLGSFGVIEPGKTFLQKPFNVETLASHVRQLLDAPVTAS